MMVNRRLRRPNATIETLKEYLFVIVGAALVAISFNVFLLPNNIASGGVSGISTITYIRKITVRYFYA